MTLSLLQPSLPALLPLLPRAGARCREAQSAFDEEFGAIYSAWFHPVCRWARALGGVDADLDDLAQEVFIVVRRKLVDFDGRDIGAWLYKITSRTVSDHRRRAWFRNLFSLRSPIDIEEVPSPRRDPAEQAEGEEERLLFWRLCDHLCESRRSALVLFEIEGLSGEEIAVLQGVPVATVWTRLHHARNQLALLVRRHRAQ